MHLRDFQQLVPEDWLSPDIFSNSHGVVGHILHASLEISVKHDLHLSLPSGSIAKIRLFFLWLFDHNRKTHFTVIIVSSILTHYVPVAVFSSIV